MGWIDNIGKAITTVLEKVRPPVAPIPPILLLCEIMNRPGLSAIALASAVIARMTAEGFPTGVNEDGSENMGNKFVLILCEELIKEIQTNAVVETSIPPGAISSSGTGANMGGPVSISAYNDKMAAVKGLIR